MTLYAYDAAYQPDLNAVKAHGGIAVARYFVGPDPTWQWKRVTPQQVTAIRAAGLGVIVNFEGTADPTLTRAQGQADARAAMVDVIACGIPQDGSVAVYVSLDNLHPAADESAVGQYFDGINDILGPARMQTKVYSEGLMLDYLVSTHRVQGKQWLAAPTSWPGFNPSDPNLCMYQLVGSPVSGTDQNQVTDAHSIAAWWPPGSPYDPPGGFPMALTDAQQQQMLTQLNDLHNWYSEGTGVGQTNAGHTIAATLATAQTAINKLNALSAGLANVGGDTEDLKTAVAALGVAVKAVQDAVAAIPTGGTTSFDMVGTLTPKAP